MTRILLLENITIKMNKFKNFIRYESRDIFDKYNLRNYIELKIKMS